VGRSHRLQNTAIVQIKGRAGNCQFYLDRDDSLYLEIVVDTGAQRALECDCSYTGMNWVCGNMADLDGFIALVEDHIADFLADIHLAADRFRESADSVDSGPPVVSDY
jgi:hypothetical protein